MESVEFCVLHHSEFYWRILDHAEQNELRCKFVALFISLALSSFIKGNCGKIKKKSYLSHGVNTSHFLAGVNMRVGVHTGTVLCGIVGTRRFKFDVWSNDVTLANRMESTGKPGRVHVSEATCKFLDDTYILEDGPMVEGSDQTIWYTRTTLLDVTKHKFVCGLRLSWLGM